MNNIKGILFDKDGTILDFDSIWVPVALDLIERLADLYNIDNNADVKKEMLRVIGIENFKVNSESPLIWGTAKDISENLERVLLTNNIEKNQLANFHEKVRNEINELVKINTPLIRPKGNVIKVLSELKHMGIKIGLATSDTHESAIICLRELGIIKYFDYIGADDGNVNAKPHPELLYKFCRKCRLKPDEVAVVGDSLSDMIFADNGKAALAIAILSEQNDKDDLADKADYTINSLEELLDSNGKLMWA